jgi:SAM-dependent methyltransferase
MHQGNLEFLAYCKAKHPTHFNNANVLEVGSADWNPGLPTVRSFFEPTCKYTGIDIIPGPGVDFVVDAEDYVNLNGPYDPTVPPIHDTIMIFSVFEHTPRWLFIMEHMLDVLKPNGLLVTTFGAEGNGPHAPDPWAVVPHVDFLGCLGSEIRILEAFYESERFTPDCAGCFDVILRKNV